MLWLLFCWWKQGKHFHVTTMVKSSFSTFFAQRGEFNKHVFNLCHVYIILIIIHQIFSLAHDWSKRVMWLNIPQLKLLNIREYSPILKTACVAKKIWGIINTIASIWGEIRLGYLSLDIICSLNITVFLEQIMSSDKYPGTFLHQIFLMERITLNLIMLNYQRTCTGSSSIVIVILLFFIY